MSTRGESQLDPVWTEERNALLARLRDKEAEAGVLGRALVRRRDAAAAAGFCTMSPVHQLGHAFEALGLSVWSSIEEIIQVVEEAYILGLDLQSPECAGALFFLTSTIRHPRLEPVRFNLLSNELVALSGRHHTALGLVAMTGLELDDLSEGRAWGTESPAPFQFSDEGDLEYEAELVEGWPAEAPSDVKVSSPPSTSSRSEHPDLPTLPAPLDRALSQSPLLFMRAQNILLQQSLKDHQTASASADVNSRRKTLLPEPGGNVSREAWRAASADLENRGEKTARLDSMRKEQLDAFRQEKERDQSVILTLRQLLFDAHACGDELSRALRLQQSATVRLEADVKALQSSMEAAAAWLIKSVRPVVEQQWSRISSLANENLALRGALAAHGTHLKVLAFTGIVNAIAGLAQQYGL
ncbi:hypothetical protein RQP46_002865 [Phenoliferia psychrophenolica]